MQIENHPFEPWLPVNAHLLMLGTFPPSPKRWCMPWYYPNFQNDMWRIFGIIFFGDKLHFVDAEKKQYRLDAIKEFLEEKGVAIFDTAQKVIRTKNTASDKDLLIVEPADLDGMLSIIISRKLRRWEAMWSSPSKIAPCVSIGCQAAVEPIHCL